MPDINLTINENPKDEASSPETANQLSPSEYKDKVIKLLQEAKEILKNDSTENATQAVSYIDMAVNQLFGEIKTKDRKADDSELPVKDEKSLEDKLTEK